MEMSLMATREAVQEDLLRRIENLRALILSGKVRAISYVYVSEDGMEWGHSSYEKANDALCMIALFDGCKLDLVNHVMPCQCAVRGPVVARGGGNASGVEGATAFASSNGRGGAGT